MLYIGILKSFGKEYYYCACYQFERDSYYVFDELGIHWKEVNTYDELLTYVPTIKEHLEGLNIDKGFFKEGKVVLVEYSQYVEKYLNIDIDDIRNEDNISAKIYVPYPEQNDNNILKSKLYIITMTKKQNFTDVEIINETDDERGERRWNEIKDIPVDKPIIYLYPQETTELTVKLGNLEKIICSYPKYEDKWKVIAESDGTLTDVETQRKLYALYWEGKDMQQPEMTEGFIVKGEDTIEFLEEKLEILGLNERESEEFIIYWLPKMQNNKYNYIRFATTEEINEYMPLEFSVQPDSIVRILMQYKAIEEYIEIPEQKLETPKREGFVVVEWGGTEIK